MNRSDIEISSEVENTLLYDFYHSTYLTIAKLTMTYHE
jgi:hypothetical protein